MTAPTPAPIEARIDPFAQPDTAGSYLRVLLASFLVISGKVEWTLVVVMAPCALLGGNLGGHFARSLPAHRLRSFVIVFGVVVAIVYLVK